MKKKKTKLRIDRILIVVFFFALIILIFNFIMNLKITNIYIYDNYYLTDQQIIEMAEISDYPSTFKNLKFQIEKRLEKNNLIKSAKVEKKGFTKVYIYVEENRPLFYYNYNSSTVHLDGTSTNKYNIPTVLNYITDNYYDEFISEMGKLDIDILNRISEIKFYPNEVDDNRFLLTMSDGNFVYVNLTTFEKLNKYLSILENLPNKKGILYLDYGNNFEIIK